MASRPEAVDVHEEDALEALVDLALDELDDLLDPDERPLQATELALGFQAIADWLATNPPQGEVPEAYTVPPPRRQAGPNPFAQHLDVKLDRSRTERWFTDEALGVHGMVDLVHAPTRLVDFKSSRKPPSLGETARRARVDRSKKPPRLQPSVYLLHHRAIVPDEPLAFTFVDLLGHRDEAVQGQASVDDLARELTYRPGSFAEHAATREVFETVVKTSNKREDVFDAVGYPAYRAYIEEQGGPPTGDKARAKASPFADGLVELAQDKRGAPATSETAARTAVTQLVKLEARTLYEADLDRLEAHVDDLLERLATWRTSRFPVPDDVDGDELAHRDLVLEDLSRHRPAAPHGGSPDG